MELEFRNADGRICCHATHKDYLCPKCHARAGVTTGAVTLNPPPSTDVSSFAPPNSYQIALDKMKEARS